MKSRLFVFVLLSCIFCALMTIASSISLLQSAGGFGVKAYIAYIAYTIFARQGILDGPCLCNARDTYDPFDASRRKLFSFDLYSIKSCPQ
jgi:hypothetical protein